MSAENGTHTSDACCTRGVPITASAAEYTPKGTYQTLAATSCYVVGSQESTKAIFYIYDIFGFTSQTLQGADILAAAGYLVIIPDILDGEPAKLEWLTSSSEETKAQFGKWRTRIADPQPHLERLTRIVHAVKDQFKRIQTYGSIGFCWGGKLVSLSSGANTLWKAGIQTSPARVDAADAKKVTIPMMMLASKDEPAADVAAFDAALTVPKHVETFDTQIHGWMSARADLADETVRKEFERGYALSVEWFGKHL